VNRKSRLVKKGRRERRGERGRGDAEREKGGRGDEAMRRPGTPGSPDRPLAFIASSPILPFPPLRVSPAVPFFPNLAFLFTIHYPVSTTANVSIQTKAQKQHASLLDTRALFLITLCVSILAFLPYQFWRQPSIVDRANWDYFAQVIARGGVPYVDVVNIK